MGRRGNGGWQSQSCRLAGENTTTSLGRQERDTTKGGGGGEGELADVRRKYHKRQHGNQSGKTRGKWEVEFLAQLKAAAHQEAVVLTRGQEVEAAQQGATRQPAGENEGKGLKMDT